MKSQRNRYTLLSHTGHAARDTLCLLAHEVYGLCSGAYACPWRRAAWDVVLLPSITVLQLVNWVCLWLDEVLFPSAREVEVRRPVFIVGPPRSGTTHLHRVLAEDVERFAAASAWEVFLAPSILQKKTLRGVARLDAKLDRPVARGVRRVERWLLGGFDETHPSALTEPEEDYFYLMAVHACTGLALVFPRWPALRRLMPGVTPDTEAPRRRALDFYRRCLRKQVYVDGTDRVVLSKNASFSSWMDVLPEVFPDARFVVCMRKASETVPSMLSTAEKAMEGFAATPRGGDIRGVLVEAMKAHYRTLRERVKTLSDARVSVVNIGELKEDLPETLARLDRKLDLGVSPGFRDRWAEMGERSRGHASRHRYTAEQFGLDPDVLDRKCPVVEEWLPGGGS